MADRPGRRSEDRLREEIVIWLATVRADGRPAAIPVWFTWDGSSFLVFSRPGPKVEDVRRDGRVHLHLNTAPDDVTRVDGEASIEEGPSAIEEPAYMRKYARHIARIGHTPETFVRSYPVRMRIRPLRWYSDSG